METIHDMLYVVIGQNYEQDMVAYVFHHECESDESLSEQMTDCVVHSPDVIDKDTLLYIMNMMQFSEHLSHEILKNLNLLSDSEEFVKLLDDFKGQKITIEEAAMAIQRHPSVQSLVSEVKEFLDS